MRVPLGGIADENEPNARLRARGVGGVEHVSDPVHHAVGGHLTRQEGLDDAPNPLLGWRRARARRSGVRLGREILPAEEDFHDGGSPAVNSGHGRPALSDALR